MFKYHFNGSIEIPKLSDPISVSWGHWSTETHDSFDTLEMSARTDIKLSIGPKQIETILKQAMTNSEERNEYAQDRSSWKIIFSLLIR